MTANSEATSLWSSSPQSLFGDRRASQAGDILTVTIEINDEAEFKNSVTTDRDSNETFSMNSFFGLPEKINGILPQGATMSPAVDVTRNSSVNGSGNLKREENLTLRLAARVVDVLPNGYLRLSGKQEIIVNNEIRYLQITGLARTQDITRQNIITYDKIAEARIFYGGQGQISNELRAKRGEKFIRKVVPF
jgi:flagellar L-ring protein precursor FlgH